MGRQAKYNTTIQQDINPFNCGYFLDGENLLWLLLH